MLSSKTSKHDVNVEKKSTTPELSNNNNSNPSSSIQTSSSATTATTKTTSNSQHILKQQISVALIDSIELVPTSVVPSEQVLKAYTFKDVIGTYVVF